MIIDIHNHPDWYGYNIDRYIENMDKFNIDKTVILSWECPENEFSPGYLSNLTPAAVEEGTPLSFYRCVQYVEKRPDRFILGYAPDPRRPEAIDKLKSAVGLYGVKICGEVKLRMMYDNPDAIRMWRACGEMELPILVHIDYEFNGKSNYPRPNYWYGGGIDAFERAIAKCPEANFIGHAPGFWAHMSNDDLFDKVVYPTGPVIPGGAIERMLEKYPNFYCDISAGSGARALARDKEYTKALITRFPDRFMYGRDYFDNIHQETLATLDLPKDILDMIYYKNTARLLKLDL